MPITITYALLPTTSITITITILHVCIINFYFIQPWNIATIAIAHLEVFCHLLLLDISYNNKIAIATLHIAIAIAIAITIADCNASSVLPHTFLKWR